MIATHSDVKIAASPRKGRPNLSFEFFPPKTPNGETRLWEVYGRLAGLAPDFVSITYGAGGSTRERTHRVVQRLVGEARAPVAAHITCVNASRAAVNEVLQAYWDAGVRRLVALRGDPAGGVHAAYAPHPEGYAFALDLIDGARKIGDFEIYAAAYPETHPQATSPEADLDNLKRKFDAGASAAITQFFADPARFLRFRDRAAAAGVTGPILPGIMPIGNVAGYLKMSAACGASVPAAIAKAIDGLDAEPELRFGVAVALCADLCRNLIAEGVDHLHFYTLNRVDLTLCVLRALGWEESQTAASPETDQSRVQS